MFPQMTGLKDLCLVEIIKIRGKFEQNRLKRLQENSFRVDNDRYAHF